MMSSLPRQYESCLPVGHGLPKGRTHPYEFDKSWGVRG
jgi:hypothetical protein